MQGGFPVWASKPVAVVGGARGTIIGSLELFFDIFFPIFGAIFVEIFDLLFG